MIRHRTLFAGTAGRRCCQRLSPTVLVLFALGLLASPPAMAADIDALPPSGMILDQPGQYTVTHDLSYAGEGAAITVIADGVVLDLHGNRLTGPGGSTGAYGVYVPTGSGAVIENGTVTGFDFGILLDMATYSVSLSGITAQGNHDGIGVVGRGNTIAGNTANRNDAVGIVVLEGESNIVSGNTTQGNRIGIAVLDGDRNTVSGNTASGNGAIGIGAFHSVGNSLSDNTALGNGGFDLADDVPCENIWTGNSSGTTNGSPCLVGSISSG